MALDLRGSLDIRRKFLCYVNDDTLLIHNHSAVTLLNHENGEMKMFRPPTLRNVDVVAGHSEYHLFAIAERGLRAKIQVFKHPDCQMLSEMSGALLEYTAIAFSNSTYLAACSGAPDFRLTLWDVYSGTGLINVDYGVDVRVTSLIFNPANWRQLCLISSDIGQLCIWTIERASESYTIRPNDVSMPFVNEFGMEEALESVMGGIMAEKTDVTDASRPTLASVRNTKTRQLNEIDVPRFAMAELVQPFAEKFEVDPFDKPRLVPAATCFTPAGELIVACTSAHLLAFNLYPEPDNDEAITPSTAGRVSYPYRCLLAPAFKKSAGEEGSDDYWQPQPGDFDQLIMHTAGIFAISSLTGIIRILSPVQPSTRSVALISQLDLGSQASGFLSATFSPRYDQMTLMSTRRCMLVFKDIDSKVMPLASNRSGASPVPEMQTPRQSTNTANVRPILHFGSGNVVGIAPLATDADASVALTSDGCLHVWDMPPDRAKTVQVGSIYLPSYNGSITSWSGLATCVAYRMAVASTQTGDLQFIDLTTPSAPKFVRGVRLSRRPIIGLKFDPVCQLLVVLAADGCLFLVDPRPSKLFQVLGCLQLPPGTPVAGAFDVFATAPDAEGLTTGAGDRVSVVVGYRIQSELINVQLGADGTAPAPYSRLALYRFNASRIRQALSELYFNPIRRDFRETATGRILVQLTAPITSMALVEHHLLQCISAAGSKLTTFSLSSAITAANVVAEQLPQQTSAQQQAEVVQPAVEPADTPVRNGVCVASTVDPKAVLLVGADGRVSIVMGTEQSRDIVLESLLPLGQPAYGGVVSWTILASTDSLRILAVGKDGSGTILLARNQKAWNASDDSVKELLTRLKERWRAITSSESTVLRSMIPATSRAGLLDASKTAPNQATPTLSYVVPAVSLQPDSTWLEAVNAAAINADDKLVADKKSEILDRSNRIRDHLLGLMADNEAKPELEKLEHHEFDLDVAEQSRLAQEGDVSAKKLRLQLEAEQAGRAAMIQRVRTECWDSLKVKPKAITGITTQLRVNNYPLRTRSAADLAYLDSIKKIREIELAEQRLTEGQPGGSTDGAGGNTTGDAEEGTTANGQSAKGQQGSFAHEFGADITYNYDQFHLYSREQKIYQIAMLKDNIYRMQENFNKEFTEMCRRKEADISSMSERNRRLRQIQNLLEVFDKRPSGDKLLDVKLGLVEDTDQLFTIPDSEVPAEKWLSPADRKKAEEQAKLEAERMKERGDNPRERGLNDMMGGVLEVKKEDELRKDVPVPVFLAEGKPQEEWTEDEHKIFAEYEKRCRELQDEREKYRKVVDTEGKKLRQQISETVGSFEEVLRAFFVRKLKTSMAIGQEEMKIARIQLDIVTESSLVAQINELSRRLDAKRATLTSAQKSVIDAKRVISEVQEQYEVLVAEDKLLEKGFRREFSDVNSAAIEPLLRQFRRRAKGLKTGSQLVQAIASMAGHGNPFADRPSTATQQNLAKNQMEAAIMELDRDNNCPEGVDPPVWRRLCEYRRQKIEKENKIKETALIQADAQAFMAKRQQDEERLRVECERITIELQRLGENFERYSINLEAQICMKQGQVEVQSMDSECPLLPNYSDGVLVHRGVVEQLNNCILDQGASKIGNMERAQKTRRDIVRLEWDHRQLQMEMEDIDEKIHDIAKLRLTRQVQEFLATPDYDTKIQKEMAVLESTLISTQQNHAKVMKRLKRALIDVEGEATQGSEANGILETELDDLNVTVCERRRIAEVTTGRREAEVARKQRYASVVARSRLVEVARAQASEIAVLRQEVERLRLKTFPALVQLD